MRINRAIDSIIGGLENLTVKIPAARAQLFAQMAIIGEPHAPPLNGVRGGSDNTPTEAAALAYDHLRRQLRALDADLDAVALIVRNLNRDCDSILGTRVKPLRCDANGRDGALEWGDFTCQDAPTKSTLCARCYMRERRWRVSRGLPTREEPAA